MANRAAKSETTFVKHDGSTMTIRLSEDTYEAAYRAAKTLKARFFITAVLYDVMRDGHWWEIIDMDKVQERNPTPGDVTMPEPLKVFQPECLDAAVVYAVAMLGRR